MTMKVIILKDHGDYKAGFEGFVPRTLGRSLCDQSVAIPFCTKRKSPEYQEFLKELKPKRKTNRKKAEKAIQKKVKVRETAKMTNEEN